jgi:hypothetical protein
VVTAHLSGCAKKRTESFIKILTPNIQYSDLVARFRELDIAPRKTHITAATSVSLLYVTTVTIIPYTLTFCKKNFRIFSLNPNEILKFLPVLYVQTAQAQCVYINLK